MNKSIIRSVIVVCLGFVITSSYAGGKHHNKFMAFFDTNQDGNVTLDEFNQAAELRFKSMDTDSNGTVNATEFKHYVQSRREQRKEQHYLKVDLNKDGQISKDEFMTAKQNHAESKFKKMDKNNDGLISSDEFKRCNNKRGFKKHHGKNIFMKLDTDGDGSVTKAESHTAWTTWFKRMDTNADNVVTIEEIKTARENRKR